MESGILVAIEGIDGSGKTTLLKEIEKRYGNKTVFTIQSGGKDPEDVERYIKAIVTDENKKMENQTEALLYFAGLSHKTQHHIIPALNQYKIVVVDRYILSTFVHSHFMNQINSSISKTIINFATGGLKPKFTFLCDISAEEANKRLLNRGEQLTKREKKGNQFYEMLRNGFKESVAEFSEEYVIIDTQVNPISNLPSFFSVLDDYAK